MAKVEKEVVETTNSDGSVKTQKTVVGNEADSNSGFKAGQLIYWLVGIIEALLAMRFVLSLLGANRSNAFAEFIYSVTYPLVAPFYGLFNNTFAYGVARIETETLIAMAVYALIGWAIVRLIQIVSNTDKA